MNLIENRHIRVFLSSTFRDMQDERDYLMKRTFPQLRRIALERDVTLTELDLRWGITKEESESGKVVEICLKEIENSIPFFIGIIGNRYGWVPEAKDLGDNVTIQFPSVKDYLSERLSVTEMEMQFGVLERQEDMHAFFFIKEGDDKKSDNPEMLERLKKSVINNSRYPVEYYSSAEELAQKVHRAFTNLIDNLYGEKNLLPEEKFRLAQKSFLNNLCKGYIRNANYFNRISLWCNNPKERIYVITGESGLGKSALIANWVKEKETDALCAFNIAYSFVGIGGNEGALEPVVKDLSAQIIELYYLGRNQGEYSLKSLFEEVACQSKPLVIVIDAVNQLVDIDDVKLMNWIPEVPKNIKIIVSTLVNDKTYDTLVNMRHCTSLTISPLNLAQRHLLIQEYISQFGKKLTDSQYNNILSYGPTANTLVLKTLLDEIITYGDYYSLDQKITSLLSSNSIEGFYDAIIESYENVFGPSVKDILSLIAVSKKGLSESEIISLLEITPLAWSQFYCSFGRHLQASNGLLYYSHINIKLAVSTRYSLDKKSNAAIYRKRILSYFKGSSANRDREEVVFQLYKLNYRKRLYRFLSDEDVFEYLYDEDPSSLRTFWESLNSLNPDIKDFCQTIDKLDETGDRHRIYSKLSFFCREDLACIEDSVFFAKKTLENATTKEMQADSFSYLALAYEAIGDYNEVLSCHKKAYNLREQIFGPDYTDTASSLHGIGSAYECLGNYRLALRFLKRAMRIWERNFGNIHDNTASCYNSIGVAYSNAGQHKSAIQYGNKALRARLQLYGRSHYDVAASYNNLSLDYSALGNFEKAIKYCREALKIWQELYGSDLYPDIAKCYNNLGVIYSTNGKQEQALPYFQKGLETNISLYGEKHPETATSYNNVGVVYKNLGEYSQSISYTKKAISIWSALFGKDYPRVGIAYRNLGETYRIYNQPRNAINSMLKSADIQIKNYGVDSDKLILIYNTIGVQYRILEQFQEAITYHEKALAVATKRKNKEMIAILNNRLGLVYELQQENDKAIERFTIARDLFLELNDQNNVNDNQTHIDKLSPSVSLR